MNGRVPELGVVMRSYTLSTVVALGLSAAIALAANLTLAWYVLIGVGIGAVILIFRSIKSRVVRLLAVAAAAVTLLVGLIFFTTLSSCCFTVAPTGSSQSAPASKL